MAQRLLEMRPFEMTEEDKNAWARLQSAIDVARYRATKPLIIRQIGKVAKVGHGRTVVRWEDGSREKVDPLVFDEVFARFRVGQPFEAVVTRNPATFRIIRAEAVRRLPNQALPEDLSKAIWNRAVNAEVQEATGVRSADIDETFWLQKQTE